MAAGAQTDSRRRGRGLDRVVRLALPQERRLRRARGHDRQRRAGAGRRRAAGADHPRPDAARHRRDRDLPARPQDLRRADPDADRPRRGRRQDHRARGRRRRLPDEAVQPARARRAREERPAPLGARAAPRREEELRHGDLVDQRRPPRGEGRRARRSSWRRRSSTCSGSCSTTSGLVLTRDQLLERVWGYTFAGDTRTVDVHVRQLRRKLGDASPIVTVWGVGYKVGPERAPAPAARNSRVPLAALSPAGALPGRDRALRARHEPDRAAPLPGLHPRRDPQRAPAGGAAGSRSSTRSRPCAPSTRSKAAPTFAAAKLEAATGDRLFYVGPSLFPGEDSGLDPGHAEATRRRPRRRAGSSRSSSGRPARTGRSSPSRTRPAGRRDACSATVVAKPKAELRDAG